MSRPALAAAWDFVPPLSEADGGVKDNPTPDGIALGREIARLTDGAEVEARRLHPNLRERCDDCAFRLGTPPNGSPGTLMNALKCAMERIPFHCHKGVADGDEPTELCAGWVIFSMETAR